MTKTLEKTYDGIIIGAGHHDLILGSYLAKAGLDILLVERRLTYGGGPGIRMRAHNLFLDSGFADKCPRPGMTDYITPAAFFASRGTRSASSRFRPIASDAHI